MLQSYLPDSLIRLQPMDSVIVDVSDASDSDDHRFLADETPGVFLPSPCSLIFDLIRFLRSEVGGTSYGPVLVIYFERDRLSIFLDVVVVGTLREFTGVISGLAVPR